MKFEVLRDTREKDQKGWIFPASGNCLGTVDQKLDTGDYTLRGYEAKFIVERKGSISEFAKNLVEKRFDRELVRLESFQYPFIVLEFELWDVVNWPMSSGIPEEKWPDLVLTPKIIMCKLNELQLKYKTKVILAGEHGLEFTYSLMKRVVENVKAH